MPEQESGEGGFECKPHEPHTYAALDPSLPFACSAQPGAVPLSRYEPPPPHTLAMRPSQAAADGRRSAIPGTVPLALPLLARVLSSATDASTSQAPVYPPDRSTRSLSSARFVAQIPYCTTDATRLHTSVVRPVASTGIGAWLPHPVARAAANNPTLAVQASSSLPCI